MAGSDDADGQANPHAAWRFSVAQGVNAAYGPAPGLAVLAVAGSVGTGLADRWSDLEVDCYWWEPPSDCDRRRPVGELGATVEAFWAYDGSDAEWSEDYRLGTLPVTVSNFTVATVEAFLDAVLRDADTDPVKHFRLAAIEGCRVLRGESLLAGWRQRAAGYPDALVQAVAAEALSPAQLPGWSARYALAERGDRIALHALLSAVEQGVLGAILALNRTYRSHRQAKWQRHLLAGLPLVPARLEARLDQLWDRDPVIALGEAEALVAETIELAEGQVGADLSGVRAALGERRQAAAPPATA